MKCPVCPVHIHENWAEESLVVSDDDEYNTDSSGRLWFVQSMSCPSCSEVLVRLDVRLKEESENGFPKLVYPATANQISAAYKVVPVNLRNDFQEASAILHLSPKASAAISRRILQDVLSSAGYTEATLYAQLTSTLDQMDTSRILPEHIRKYIDVVRQCGNMAAHPMKDATTGLVIDVELEEADWCLDLVKALLDFYYVLPEESNRKLKTVNSKLSSVGKPSVKSK